jgi:DnaA family protein
MHQLVLNIGPAVEPGFDNYVAGPNTEAVASVRSFAAGETREAVLYLWGETGSGRTHLLHAATRANPALVTADDVQALEEPAQQLLFAAINEARQGGAPVLAAGSQPPAQLPLREDLRTRLAWGLVYQLKPLSDEDKALHLRSQAARRGLRLSDEVLGYLLSRLPRDLASLNSVLEALDRYSLEAKRPLTLPLVREALERRTGQAWLGRHKDNP